MPKPRNRDPLTNRGDDSPQVWTKFSKNEMPALRRYARRLAKAKSTTVHDIVVEHLKTAGELPKE